MSRFATRPSLRLRRWLRLFAPALPGLGLAGILVAAGASRGQDAPPTKSYLNKSAITLPIQLEDRYRSQLKSIQLYVKTSASSPWKLHEQAVPTQQSFTYRAPADGEYAFCIVSVDTAGRSFPADVAKQGPDLIVAIDTQTPQIAVERSSTLAEGHIVRFEARDPNLDPAKTKFSYQTGEKWTDLTPQPGKADTFCIPAQATWTGMVRAVAVDLAGNTVTREINLATSAAVAAGAFNKGTLPSAPAAPPTLPLVQPKTVVPPKTLPIADPQVPETLVMVDPVTLQPQGPPQPIVPLTGSQPIAPSPTPMLPRLSGTPIPPLPSTTQSSAVQPSAVQPGAVQPMPPGAAQSAAAAPGKLSTSIVHRLAPVEPASERPQPAEPAEPATPRQLPTGMHEVKSTALSQREPQTPPVAPAIPELPASPAATVAPASPSGTAPQQPSQPQLLSATRTFVDYKLEALGPSGVGKVEVWCTRDHGKTWLRVGEDADRQSPVEVNFPGEGLFGVSVVVSNGRGFGGSPPRPGETPEYWVEIDTARPIAEITAIHAANDGALHISWTAKDKNLGKEPIELSYAAQREGPWHSIAKNLRNDGVYRWMPPAEVGSRAYFRMVVRDDAGNVTNSETTQPVPLDDQSRPRGRVLSFSISAASGAAPASRVTELPPPRTSASPAFPQR